MAVCRMQCAFGADTGLPRDRFVITPHFRTSFGADTGDDVDALAEDLATGLLNFVGNGTGREIVARAYSAQDPPPNLPLAVAIRNPNGFVASTLPRELALCLSFYSEFNLPRRRGRLYVPVPLLSTGTTAGVRPSGTMIEKMQTLVPLFTGLGGADVDWCVYSRADDEARPVTNVWIDDEWDAQRRRGLASTARWQTTTDEAGTPITP
jgi:hypothetical protein